MFGLFKRKKQVDIIIAKTRINGVEISTIRLPINHGDANNPLWFETMVFGGDQCGELERYSSINLALAGHFRWVLALREQSCHVSL